ncbi:MAG: hypothetical protein ACOC8B_05615 [Gemmatimonadota bacterium]
MVVAGIMLLVAGCELDDGGGLLVTSPGGATDVVGLWTGVESIAGMDGFEGVDVGSIEEGIRFAVALRLAADGRFTLHAFDFPAAAGSERRVCTGIYDRDGRTLKFFPDAVCRPLPLSRYTIGRTAPDGLTLEASTARTPGGGEPVGDIRVRFELERD